MLLNLIAAEANPAPAVDQQPVVEHEAPAADHSKRHHNNDAKGTDALTSGLNRGCVSHVKCHNKG